MFNPDLGSESNNHPPLIFNGKKFAAGPDSELQAIECLEEAIEHKPSDNIAIFAIAQIYHKRGAYLKAIPLLERIRDHSNERTQSMARPMLLECYTRTNEMLKAAELKELMRKKS